MTAFFLPYFIISFYFKELNSDTARLKSTSQFEIQ